MVELLIISLLLIIPFVTTAAEVAADRICGLYYMVDKFTSGEQCKVRIYRTENGTYDARVVWMDKPNHPDGTRRLDVKNPNPELRNIPCDSVVMMRHLTYNADKNEWQNGEVYNPQNGRFYRSNIRFENDSTLRVRGYWGISLLGVTMFWDKLE